MREQTRSLKEDDKSLKPYAMMLSEDKRGNAYKTFSESATPANQCPQGSTVKFLVIGYREMPPVRVVQNHVASLLAVENEADFLECFYCVATGDDG